MRKIRLFFAYILALFASPKKAAEAVNEAVDVEDLDERILKI